MCRLYCVIMVCDHKPAAIGVAECLRYSKGQCEAKEIEYTTYQQHYHRNCSQCPVGKTWLETEYRMALCRERTKCIQRLEDMKAQDVLWGAVQVREKNLAQQGSGAESRRQRRNAELTTEKSQGSTVEAVSEGEPAQAELLEARAKMAIMRLLQDS